MPIDKTKKNIFLLATCQAPFMTSTSAVFTTSALEQDEFKWNQAAKTLLPCPLPPEGRRGTQLQDLGILPLRPRGRRGPG